MKKDLPLSHNAPRIAGVILQDINLGTVRRALEAGADLLEIRVDSFKERDISCLERSFKRLRSFTSRRKIPIILTVRSKREGGVLSLSGRERAEIFNNLIPFADIIDLELSSSGELKNVLKSAHRRGKTVIISYHNFGSTPGINVLKGIVKKGQDAGADIVKIATKARGREDVRTLAGLLLSSPGRLIVIAMGRYGAASRVFFPMLGSIVTYGSITGASAPGQIPVSALKEAFLDYRINV